MFFRTAGSRRPVGTIFQRFGPFSLQAFHRKMHFGGVAAGTRKCGNVAPARVWAAFAKTQVLRQAGLQAPAFWEACVFPANNAENMKRSTFQSQPLKGRRGDSTWKMWGKIECRKAAPAAKWLPPEGFHQNAVRAQVF